MKDPVVRIAAKFQYKIPSLRTDSRFTDTISWSQGRPHRKSSYKDLNEAGRSQLMWTLSSASTWEIQVQLKTVQWNVIIIIIIICLLYTSDAADE